mmetsp:Transcript_86105/g.244230  ORF Transcript_86105/g.244230 Transcript_86105/m.244230 type:complete len:221 (+) Transcript_86105:962-1624(+)
MGLSLSVDMASLSFSSMQSPFSTRCAVKFLAWCVCFLNWERICQTTWPAWMGRRTGRTQWRTKPETTEAPSATSARLMPKVWASRGAPITRPWSAACASAWKPISRPSTNACSSTCSTTKNPGFRSRSSSWSLDEWLEWWEMIPATTSFAKAGSRSISCIAREAPTAYMAALSVKAAESSEMNCVLVGKAPCAERLNSSLIPLAFVKIVESSAAGALPSG